MRIIAYYYLSENRELKGHATIADTNPKPHRKEEQDELNLILKGIHCLLLLCIIEPLEKTATNPPH
jgi:hypothetical protein